MSQKELLLNRYSDSREMRVSSLETSVSSLETRLSSRETRHSSLETRLSSREKRDETGNLLLSGTVYVI